MSTTSLEIIKIKAEYLDVLKYFDDGENGKKTTIKEMFIPSSVNEIFYQDFRTLTTITGEGLNSQKKFNFFYVGKNLFDVHTYLSVLGFTDPTNSISTKLSQIKIIHLNTFTTLKEDIMMPQKLADILDNQILNETFENNFPALIEIYLRTILVIYEFKTRIKDIYTFLEKSVSEETNKSLKNAKQNALNKLSQLCENNKQGVSTIDNLIPKIFGLLQENKLTVNNHDEYEIYKSQEINKQTFIKNLEGRYDYYKTKYEQIVTITKAIKEGYDAMFELIDIDLLTQKYYEIIDKINKRKALAVRMLQFQVPTLGAENVDLQYKPRIFDLNIYIDKDGEIKNVIYEGYSDIRKGLAEIAKIEMLEQARKNQETQEKYAKLKIHRDEEKKKQDERVNMWYQETIKAAMIKYRNNYHKLELAVKNINKTMKMDDNSAYGKTQAKLKTMEEIIAEMANNKYITRNREKQYNNFLKKSKPKSTFITNIIGRHYPPTANAEQIAKARNAEDSKQTVTNPKTDNFIPVIDDVTYDFSELPFNNIEDIEFDKVEKSEFDKKKAEFLGVKLGQEKKKVKDLEKELKQNIDHVNREYKDKMENCNEERENLRKSIGEIFQRFTDNTYHEIISKMEFYKNEFSTGYDVNVDEIIDKIVNEDKQPTSLQKGMAAKMKELQDARAAARPTRGGRRKKVGKKTRKKKNIKKTRK